MFFLRIEETKCRLVSVIALYDETTLRPELIQIFRRIKISVDPGISPLLTGILPKYFIHSRFDRA